MEPSKVRRLASVLISSQLRSGRSTSDPKSFLGRPEVIGLVDVGLFLVAFAFVTEVVHLSTTMSAAGWRSLVVGVLPLVPLAAVGVVLVAGASFELMSNARFASSDAANWMPITPTEYVAASATAIAYTYSPAIALVLGGVGPIALAGGLGPVYGLAIVLAVLSLYEGALLVEMVRAVSNRAGSIGSARHGTAGVLLRAIALIFVIVLFDLALNPVFLLRFAGVLVGVPAILDAIPLFWSSSALTSAASGSYVAAAGYAAAQVVLLVLLALVAAFLRERYWVPTPLEVRLGEHRYAERHAVLSGLGLSRSETAIVGKDLRGFVRRRELLPLLVIPIVLIVILAVEGSGFGLFTLLLWIGWVAGFFGLLLGATSVGQERRGLQVLFSFPVSARSVFRAKATAVLIPVLIGVVAMTTGVGLFYGFPWWVLAASIALCIADATVLVLWGLVFASRYSDFQERPRPQFVRPGAMIGATFSGLVLLGAIVVPAAYALAAPSSTSIDLGLLAGVIALATGTFAFLLARSGFERLFRELPF